MTIVKITTTTPLDFEPGDIVKVAGRGPTATPYQRAQRGGDGSTFLYPVMPGRNRHERRVTAARHRKAEIS